MGLLSTVAKKMKKHSALGTAAPRYAVVAQTLMREIENGKYKVGTMFPTELEICERFAISRYTAREAIRRLTELGLLSRRAGIGTKVKAQSASARYTASISDPTELFAFTQKTRLEVLSEDWVTIAGELATILPEAEGERWLRFTILRYLDGSDEPIAYSEIIVHPTYESIRDHIREPGMMIYKLIEEIHEEPVQELKQEIRCISTPKKIAAILGTRANSPALRVLRYYLGPHDALMSVAINTYPQDRFTVTTHWRLGWEADTQ